MTTTNADSEPGQPLGLALTEGLGLEPERAAFEAWYSDGGRYPKSVERHGNGYKLMGAHSAWTAWKACWPLAQAAERERCALICESQPERLRGDGVWACDQQACADAIRKA